MVRARPVIAGRGSNTLACDPCLLFPFESLLLNRDHRHRSPHRPTPVLFDRSPLWEISVSPCLRQIGQPLSLLSCSGELAQIGDPIPRSRPSPELLQVPAPRLHDLRILCIWLSSGFRLQPPSHTSTIAGHRARTILGAPASVGQIVSAMAACGLAS
ncbi:hypothetical protein FA13DRAFT_329155 [Coprinellus micaceus]|uniref:Uncharacterized protein n=1 Tax=Coprinellus micaceus TaxID=71717 RepID=A0A4Y7SD83_COPMI|nr:hypothetical protein FA13DRAFT_329155 [Coprinellus micaceus]